MSSDVEPFALADLIKFLLQGLACDSQQARRQRAVVPGSTWLRWPENGVFRFNQIQIGRHNPSKQRVAGSKPVARSRYEFLPGEQSHSWKLLALSRLWEP
jgi:hypothetical protein